MNEAKIHGLSVLILRTEFHSDHIKIVVGTFSENARDDKLITVSQKYLMMAYVPLHHSFGKSPLILL